MDRHKTGALGIRKFVLKNHLTKLEQVLMLCCNFVLANMMQLRSFIRENIVCFLLVTSEQNIRSNESYKYQ